MPGLSKLSLPVHISPQKPCQHFSSPPYVPCVPLSLLSCTFRTTASHQQSLSTTYDIMGKQCDIYYVVAKVLLLHFFLGIILVLTSKYIRFPAGCIGSMVMRYGGDLPEAKKLPVYQTIWCHIP